MGDRWTDLQESLGSEDFAWLRKQLVDLGPFLDPVRTAPPSEQLPDFPDIHDAAVVALLQASALIARPDLVPHIIRTGRATLQEADAARRLIEVAALAAEIERVLQELAWRVEPGVHGTGNLTDSFRALRAKGLLPLTDRENQAWNDDAAWVKAQGKRKLKGSQALPAPKRMALLWQARAEERFADSLLAGRCPRYLALLELQRLRNAHAHKRTGNMAGFTRADRVWRRMVGLLAMICVRVFVREVLVPPPARPRPAPALPASELPPQTVPVGDPAASFADASASVADAPTPRRKWLYMTAAATVAVILGTVGANLLAPRAVIPSPVGDARAPADSAPPRAVPPIVAFAPPKDADTGTRGETRQCLIAWSTRGTQVLPSLRVEEAYRARAGVTHEPSALGMLLREDRGLGSVVYVVADSLGDPEGLLRRMEAAACEARPVLSLDEALSGGSPVDDALIVGALDSSEDPRHARLLALADTGRSPRLLLTLPHVPEDRPLASSVLVSESFDCARARRAVLSAVGTADAADRFAAWGLFEGADAGDACVVPGILQGPVGARLVASALADSATPPKSLDGTWTRWTTLAPAADPTDAAWRADALARTAAVDVDVRPRKRRKTCAAWARRNGSALGDAGLLRHVVGTPVGASCLVWTLDAALTGGLDAEEVTAAVALGLGDWSWRDRAVEQAQEDARPAKASPEARRILTRLGE